MVSIEKEDWFSQTNKYNYHDLMIALYKKDTIDLKVAHAKLGGTGVWIDTSRFIKKEQGFTTQMDYSICLVNTADRLRTRYVIL